MIQKTVISMLKSSFPNRGTFLSRHGKVNGACAQFRDSGILFASANGKLYFGATGIFPSHQNHLPLQGAEMLRSRISQLKTKN